MKTTHSLPPASPIAFERVGTRLLLTYPPGTTLGQVGEVGRDYVRRVWVDGQRWVVDGFEGGVAKCWSQDLRAA